MSKNKNFTKEIPGDYPIYEIPDINSSGPSDSDIKIYKRLYLQNSKADYPPNEESIEKANGLKSLQHPTSHT
ncbi:hypothetical protein NNC19_20000 [Clostridium sp. SHJSY1]|uniref:hypothetical protein n=1 Tax=Clostridium sp. SHJSY1 TaxID=2942483 RepID=UPI0028768AFD|nr:hypothetical protein [Clostridium sp. SHJSY1]MDS0527980.1 hypothetical protein [Clostridium sp. SHJSY1]